MDLGKILRALFKSPAGWAVPETRFEHALLRSKAEHLVLAGPFGWQVGEAGNSHAMREPAVDGGLDEIGREEGKRDCHIHLADAAPLALSDAFRGCRFLGDKFLEPTAPAGDRCDQGGAIFRTYRPGVLRRHSIRHKNRTAPHCLLPRDLKGGVGCRLLAIASRCFGKLDDQLLRLNLDSCDVRLDEGPAVNLLRWFEMLRTRPDDQRLDVGCRPAGHRPGALGGAMEKGAGQVVSVLEAALAAMARAHSVAAVIEETAGQQGLGVHPCGPMIYRLLTQLGLDGVEQVPIENAGLFAIEDLTLEWHLTDIKAIAQQVGERPAAEGNAAGGRSGLQRANLGDDALFAQLGHQQVQAAKLEITAEDHAHPVRLRLVDSDPSLVGVVAERDHAADPEPLALGR